MFSFPVRLQTRIGVTIIAGMLCLVACSRAQYVAVSVERTKSANQALAKALEYEPITMDFVYINVANRKYDVVEAEFQRLFDRYQDEVLVESALQKSYDMFYPGHALVREYIDAWAETSGSAIAHTARGTYLLAAAQSARGKGTYNQLASENITKMQQFCEEAAADFKAAVERNPKLTPAWVGLRSSRRASSSGPISEIVVRIGWPCSP